jgi:hypothetical protein
MVEGWRKRLTHHRSRLHNSRGWTGFSNPNVNFQTLAWRRPGSALRMRDTALGAALRRLEAAVGVLEAASARALDVGRSGAEREAELALLEDDRARLAEELDSSTARTVRLETINRDVARRLDRTIETIRDVLKESE